ncbi:sensor histidine kinase [Micromonospora yangpuensis]|uniref:histidine kinase n=1 Tax=Micromonospora yangpuensis TaxID=683228 RepID=A0A1C6VHX5_9ACTN|nr:HAMP domain-containing sensor histidine kinase [Micromonospora yangpuensis]GGM00030.1 two-component sensor histidine kinase [Micromonospora yangpuensis]SCL65946.1 two-component system, OmpR family, sensor histidine kinase BaeS [Micromonospora yangpuensis]
MADPPAAATPRRSGRFTRTLTTRAVLVSCAVALVSVLVTALVAAPVAVRGAERRDQEALADQARLAVDVLRTRPPDAAGRRLVDQLAEQDVTVHLIEAGRADRPGLSRQVVSRLAAGHDVSGRRLVAGERSFVEGRALPGGDAVVLTRPTSPGVWRRMAGGLWLPLLAGLAAGVAAGLLLARRLARPIREAATAAARLGAGDRTVRLSPEPPEEVAELAYALNGLAAALATSEGRQREFLLSVSHELRTPLTALRGYAEALADGVIDGAAVPATGRTMLAEARHLDRLVSDLLALARLEAADFPLEPVPVDLAGLVADIGRNWADRYAAAGVPLRIDLPPPAEGLSAEDGPVGVVSAYTDPGRIRQVVDGLLENALRVVPPGAPVVVAVRPAGASATDGSAAGASATDGGVIEVRDGGPGFTEDDLAVAFERGELHRRYRGVRKVGSGLGLALAAGLVRRLGGDITAGHAPEGGAAFTVTLPSR